MKFTKKDKIRILISTALLLLFMVANFYTIRQGARCMMELYLYDKLLVAYHEAGSDGLKDELARVLAGGKMKQELALAKAFEKDLYNIQDPEKFLSDIVDAKRDRIIFLKNMRLAAFGLIMAVFLLRGVLERYVK